MLVARCGSCIVTTLDDEPHPYIMLILSTRSGKCSFPAGRRNVDESILDCIRRETYEETSRAITIGSIPEEMVVLTSRLAYCLHYHKEWKQAMRDHAAMTHDDMPSPYQEASMLIPVPYKLLSDANEANLDASLSACYPGKYVASCNPISDTVRSAIAEIYKVDMKYYPVITRPTCMEYASIEYIIGAVSRVFEDME